MTLTVALINSTMPEAKPIVEMGPIVDKTIKNLRRLRPCAWPVKRDPDGNIHYICLLPASARCSMAWPSLFLRLAYRCVVSNEKDKTSAFQVYQVGGTVHDRWAEAVHHSSKC